MIQHQRIVSISHSAKKLLLQFLVIGMLALASCTYERKNPTNTPPSLPSNTPVNPTLTRSPTPDLEAASTRIISPVDFMKNLTPGLYLAYWSQDTWYIRDVDELSSTRLLPNINSEFYPEAQLSPDNNRVVFSNISGQVSVYDFRTGKMAVYSNSEIKHAYDFKWLSGGDVLLYLGTPEEFWVPDAYVGIYGISLSTGKMFRVVDWTDNRFQYGLHDINLSKDGRWLTFYAPRISEMIAPDPNYAVYILDALCLDDPETCTGLIRLVGDGLYPSWSPDGRLWWVCSQETLSALCVSDSHTFMSSQIFVTASNLTNSSDAHFYNFSWSPNGKYVAITVEQYQSNDSNNEKETIYLVSMDKKQHIKVSGESDKNEYWEGWSPDSRYLAYSQILGYTEPYGNLGIRSPITALYLYDIETNTKIDFIDSPNDREVFDFFINIK